MGVPSTGMGEEWRRLWSRMCPGVSKRAKNSARTSAKAYAGAGRFMDVQHTHKGGKKAAVVLALGGHGDAGIAGGSGLKRGRWKSGCGRRAMCLVLRAEAVTEAVERGCTGTCRCAKAAVR